MSDAHPNTRPWRALALAMSWFIAALSVYGPLGAMPKPSKWKTKSPRLIPMGGHIPANHNPATFRCNFRDSKNRRPRGLKPGVGIRPANPNLSTPIPYHLGAKPYPPHTVLGVLDPNIVRPNPRPWRIPGKPSGHPAIRASSRSRRGPSSAN